MKKQTILYFAVGVAIFGVFYWFQFRPTKIRKECWERIEKIKSGELEIVNDGVFGLDDEVRLDLKYGGQKAIDEVFDNCLRKHGL